MNILYTAFNGKLNSSKLLLDNINCDNKLYLRNSFTTSVKQLNNKIKNNKYDLIISFGQAPLENDTIKIEEIGQGDVEYKTCYDYAKIKNKIEAKGYKVIISRNAGTYLCNNIYYNGLKYIDKNNLKANMIFIHIPKIDKITNMINLANVFNEMDLEEEKK